MRQIRWKRVILLTLSSSVIILLLLDGILAWIFVSVLIDPGCVPPRPLPGFPHPERVFLEARDGVQVEAWYYPSRNRAAVIALGGQQGAQGNRPPEILPLLREGFGVLQLGSRACAIPPAPVTLGGKEVQDAQAGLDYLRSRPDVDPGKIGMFGFSMGGAAAIRTAAREENVQAVLAEGGYYNLGEDIVEGNGPIERIYLYSIALVFRLRTGLNPWDLDPIGDVGRIAPRPVFYIFGEKELESGRGIEQFQAAGEPKILWVVPGGSHGQNHAASPLEYERRVLEFFQDSLNPASQP